MIAIIAVVMPDVPSSGQDGLSIFFLCPMSAFPFVLPAPALPLLERYPPPYHIPPLKAMDPTEVPECQASALTLFPLAGIFL